MARYAVSALPVRIYTADSVGHAPGAIVVNRDLLNSVLLGFDAGIAVARTITQDPTGSILDPLGSITIDGSRDVWAVSAKSGATVTIDVIDNASYWAPSPAQIAAQISLSGVFATTNSQLLINQASVTVAANSTFTLNAGVPFNITQSGYEILITSGWHTAPTAGDQCSVQLAWVDPNSGLNMIVDEWFIGAAANGTTLLKVHGVGPTKAAQLVVTFQNYDTTGTWDVTCILLQNSRQQPTDQWEWTNQSAVTFTADLPAIQHTTARWSGELGRKYNLSVPATSTDSSIIGLWYGQIYYAFHSRGAALNIKFSFRPKGILSDSGGNAFINQSVVDQTGIIWCPRGFVQLDVVNSSASAITFDFMANAAGATQ